MNDVLQTHFQRIDAALDTLVDSIAAYNPSAQATSDFIAANDDLGRGLDEREQPPPPHMHLHAPEPAGTTADTHTHTHTHTR